MLTTTEKFLCDKRMKELAEDEAYQKMVGDIRSSVANVNLTQTERIRVSNRGHVKADGSKTKNAEFAAKIMKNSEEHKAFLEKQVDDYNKLEKKWTDHLEECVNKHPVYTRYLKNIPGVLEKTAAPLLSEYKVESIYYIGQLFKYAGIVGDTKRKKGEKANYNVYLKKRLLGVLGKSLKNALSSPYAIIYYQSKMKLINRYMLLSNDDKKKMPLARIDLMANRKMVQQFVKDYYVAFRKIMDIPVIKSYEEANLGMVHVGTSWTDPNIFIDINAKELAAYKVKARAEKAKMKAQCEALMELAGFVNNKPKKATKKK